MNMSTSANGSQPLISVIVATYNSGSALRKTIVDILAQTYPSVEIVLIDGLSTDSSLRDIEDLAPFISYSLSERDKGIADAYNKGIAASKGDWIYFLNADDVFFKNDVLAKVAVEIARDPKAELVIGTVESDKGKVFGGRLGWRLLIRNQVHHQAIFYRTDRLRAAPYNSSYRRYGHDHEHNILLWQRKLRASYIPLTICLWGTGGISDAAKWKDYREEFKIRRNTLGILGWPFNLFTLLRFAGKNAKRLLRPT